MDDRGEFATFCAAFYALSRSKVESWSKGRRAVFVWVTVATYEHFFLS